MTLFWAGRINFLLCFLFIVTVFSSCEKKENSIGADFVGQRTPFVTGYQDTTTLIAYTSKHDSIRTRYLSYYMLGSLNDLMIGQTDCHVMTTFSLPYTQFNFTGTPSIDSIVLQLPYTTSTSFYGDINTPQDIYVYEMNEVLSTSADSVYFSNRNYNYSTTPIGHYTGDFSKIGDSVSIQGFTQKMPPHIRIRLDDLNPVLKNRLLDPNATGTGYFLNDSVFFSNFKGLAIVSKATPAAGSGCITYLNLRSEIAGVIVYYHNATDTLSVGFPLTPLTRASVHANSFDHQYNSGINIQPNFSTQHSDINYLQPSGGLKTRILLPHLFDYVKGQKIAVTGAELVFKIEPGSATSTYTLPENVLIKAADSLGRNVTLLDEFFENAYYGGAIENSSTFRFNIIRQIQYILDQYRINNRNLNYGLNLYVPVDAPVSAKRVILDTHRNAGTFKLNLTYTVIK